MAEVLEGIEYMGQVAAYRPVCPSIHSSLRTTVTGILAS
jgi:hypothetical protein